MRDDRCRVVDAGPLLRELIRRAVSLPWNHASGGREERLIRVLIDELTAVDVAPLHLPFPADARARSVCDRLYDAPDDTTTLPDWASAVGTSKRTLVRLFEAETGMSFAAWRQRLRMQQAVERLAEGAPVTAIAFEMGYQTANGFIDAFRRHFGVTPGRYFAGVGSDPDPGALSHRRV